MRYYSEPTKTTSVIFGEVYSCNHPVYNRCTLYLQGQRGLSVIQQRYNPVLKTTYWTEIDDWLVDTIYTNDRFHLYFDKRSALPINGLFPTVTIRQIMWALRMKPLKKERWETVFDRKDI